MWAQQQENSHSYVGHFSLKYNPHDQWAPSFYLGKGAAGSQKSQSAALMELSGTSKEHSSLNTSRPSTSKLRRFATALQQTLMKMHSSFKTKNAATGKGSSWKDQFNGTQDHSTPATCSVRTGAHNKPWVCGNFWCWEAGHHPHPRSGKHSSQRGRGYKIFLAVTRVTVAHLETKVLKLRQSRVLPLQIGRCVSYRSQCMEHANFLKECVCVNPATNSLICNDVLPARDVRAMVAQSLWE